MTVRPDIAELLHAGYGDRTIARQLGVTQATVTRARLTLGLPPARRGIKPAGTPEDLFWRRTKPAPDGHLDWTGYRTTKGTPAISFNGVQYTAYRIAFRIANGRTPEGYVRGTCTHRGCVAPAHMADRQMLPRAEQPLGGRPANASPAEILPLLKAGLTNREIARRLRTGPRRVARIRAAEDLKPAVLTLEQAWAAYTKPGSGGHVLWIGPLREGVPQFGHGGSYHSARRVAFSMANVRQPVGQVRSGCGRTDCVAPAHVEDQQLRDQYRNIFGGAA